MEEVTMSTTEYVMIGFMVLMGAIGIAIVIFSILGIGKRKKKK